MLFVGDFTVQCGPKPSAEVLSTVPEHRKAVMCLTEKISILDKFCQAHYYSVVGPAFTVNESTTNILNKVSVNRNTHKTRLCVDWLMKM